VIRAIAALSATLPRRLLLLLFAEGDAMITHRCCEDVYCGSRFGFARFRGTQKNALVATLKNSPNSSRSAEALTLRSRERIFLNCSLRPASLPVYRENTVIIILKPGTRFPGNEKKYAMQYKKVHKSSWNEPYSSSSSFTKQSCSKMAVCR